MYHIFSIHSSVDGYLRCFHVMAVRLLPCPASVNNEVHVSFWIMAFSSACSGVGLLDHMVVPTLSF